MTTRRSLIVVALVLPAASGGAQAAPRRVGVLAPSTAAREAMTLKPFFDEMAQLGWVEGRTVTYDRAFAGDRLEDLPRLARELVARQPDLIFAPPMPAALAAKAATATIPIVFATGVDPVGVGLVQSLARPGGNATGIISVIDSLAPKSLEILLEIMPTVRRIGLLSDPDDPRMNLDREAIEPLLRSRGIALFVAQVGDPKALDAAVAQLLRERVEAIMTDTSTTFNLRVRLVELLRGRQVALVAHRSEMVEAGALMSYAASLPGQIRSAARVVDRVLRGAAPADFPVEQPTTFELVLNLRTAAALGLTIPPVLRLRADRLIE